MTANRSCPSYFNRLLCLLLIVSLGCSRIEPPKTDDAVASKDSKQTPDGDRQSTVADEKNDQKKPKTSIKPDSDEAKNTTKESGEAKKTTKEETNAKADAGHGKTHDPKRVHTKEPNRLAKETSPYLLLHAHNPVDWYAWGPEMFEKAKKENKIIFLSIGYSSCYWCHVMERLVFSNPEIAKYMNKHFVSVKVDREERPDVDDIYMTSLHVYLRLSQSPGNGGWPLSMFLTPAGKPIAGGTYFPPEDTEHSMGFLTIMKRLTDLWANKRADLEKGADQITEIVQHEMRPGGLVLKRPEINRELVNTVITSVVQSHDSDFGGVGFRLERPNSPKFPVPTKLSLLQYAVRKQKSKPAADVLYHTLDAMAAGGIRDHVGGGFHRYSTDRKWLIPHFEKMLYDNAQLADVYTEAYRVTNKIDYKEVAEEMFGFILAEMTDPTGGFHSALDAETDEIEGKYYVWDKKDIENTLGDDAGLFSRTYGIGEESPFEHGFIIYLPNSVERVAIEERIPPAELRRKLAYLRGVMLKLRQKREMPMKDDKILTSWNGLMIRAFANAAIVFNRQQYLDAAENAAMLLLTKVRDKEGRLYRTFRKDRAKLNAYLDDYAFLVEGLLTLYKATREEKWLNAARRLTDDQIKYYWDETNGAFYFTPHHHEELLARTMNAYDSVLPSGNSVAVRNLLRLASITGEKKYREHAKSVIELFSPYVEQSPSSMTNMAVAIGEYLDDEDYRSILDRKPTDVKPKSPIININPQTKPDKPKPNTPLIPNPIDRVAATAFLSTDRLPVGAKTRIAIKLTVSPGWHINQYPASPDFLIPTTITIKSKHGTKLTQLKFPKGKDLRVQGEDDAFLVYEGTVTIFGKLEAPETAAGKTEEFELHVKYQACNDTGCERPRTIIFVAKVPVAAVGETVKAVNGKTFETP
jgi:uncharacterized protein YyaL (SSP411 family)